MGFLSRLFRSKESDPVPGLLKALRNKNEVARLQAVSELGKIGVPRASGPLLYALRDDNQEVRSAVLACLTTAGVEEADAKRVKMVYDEETPWKKGLARWSERIKLMTAAMNLPASIAGLNPLSVFGDMNRGIVGFLFDDEHKAIEAALETKRVATVVIWSNRSMTEYEFGLGNKEALEVGTRMQAKGARAFVAANCDASLEKGLFAVFKTEAKLRW